MRVTAGPAAGGDGSGGGAGRPRHVVILNASAGRKAGITTNEDVGADDIDALFDALGLPVEVHATESEDEAVATVRAAVADGCRAIVAAGGDGTFGLVARTLLRVAAERPGAVLPAVGLLPLGSAMNVARSLAIPRDLPAAAQIVAGGVTRAIDVGRLSDGTTFFEALAVGLNAELFAEAAAFDEGDWLAPPRAAGTAVRYRPSRLTLTLDDRIVSTRALVLSVSNTPFTGLGFTVAPDARLDDGRFDVRVFERFSRLELLRHFWSIALGRRRYEPKVRTYRSSRVRVESATPLCVRVDGEEADETPVEATVLPAALLVMAPHA